MVPRQLKFEGRCEEIKSHIYDCSDARQSDIFAKTTKEIAGYVGRTYKYGSDAGLAVERLTLRTLTMPTDPIASASDTEKYVWKKEVDEYVKQKSYLNQNMKTLYALVWGQCTDVMKQKIESTHDFGTLSANRDGLGLLMTIKDLVYNFQSQKYLPRALHESVRRFYTCVQSKHMSTQTYMERIEPGVVASLAVERTIDMAYSTEDCTRKGGSGQVPGRRFPPQF